MHFLISRVANGLETVAPRMRHFVQRLGHGIVEAQKQQTEAK